MWHSFRFAVVETDYPDRDLLGVLARCQDAFTEVAEERFESGAEAGDGDHLHAR
jgi:hypothetical protein